MALKILINLTGHYLKNSHKTGLVNPRCTWVLLGRSYIQHPSDHDGKTENVTAWQSPGITGMGVRTVAKRSSTMYKYNIYRTRLETFLLSKGADHFTVDNIISRYRWSLTLRFTDLEEIWELWNSVLQSDEDLLMVIKRSPESFFRSGDVKKLTGNISLFQSLGLMPLTLRKLMIRSPRTFANSLQLNTEKVAFLRDLCVRMGGEDPDHFVRKVITQNIFIFTRSIKRLSANVETIQSFMKLEGQNLLTWLQNEAPQVLNLCNSYLIENVSHIHKEMQSLGYTEDEVTRCIIKNPGILHISPHDFNSKINLLLQCGMESKTILDSPILTTLSLTMLGNRIKALQQLGYDFKGKGLNILLMNNIKLASKIVEWKNEQKHNY